MTYAILAWGHSPHSKRIFGLQRKVIRVILGLGYRDDVRDFFTQVGVLTLPCLYILHCLMMARTNVEHTYHGDLHQYETRQRGQIYIEHLRLKSSRFSYNYFSQKFFNKLSLPTRLLPVRTFKTRVKDWLIKHPYYSIDEFLSCDLPEDLAGP